MSEAKLVHLAKARQRALELRQELHAINPPRAETLKKPRKPSKLEMKIAEAKRLNEESPTIEPVAVVLVAEPEPEPEPETVVVPEVTEPVVVVKEPKQKVPSKKQKEAPIKQQRKPLMVYTPAPPPPPTPPPTVFQRNSFGFYVL
jgi:hypothetical protein